MPKLSEEQKTFIVTELAAYRSPTEVAQRVKEEFGIEIDRRQAYEYDPTKAHGKPLGKKWKDLFAKARKDFIKKASEISVSHKSYRLREIADMHLRAKQMGNLVLASSLLEQAAKEVGGSFTNRRELTGKDGKDLPAPSAVVVLPQKEFVEDGAKEGAENDESA